MVILACSQTYIAFLANCGKTWQKAEHCMQISLALDSQSKVIYCTVFLEKSKWNISNVYKLPQQTPLYQSL